MLHIVDKYLRLIKIIINVIYSNRRVSFRLPSLDVHDASSFVYKSKKVFYSSNYKTRILFLLLWAFCQGNDTCNKSNNMNSKATDFEIFYFTVLTLYGISLFCYRTGNLHSSFYQRLSIEHYFSKNCFYHRLYIQPILFVSIFKMIKRFFF